MDKEGCERLARMFASSQEHVSWRTDEWLNTQCPFAPETHQRGMDRHPSFGINAESSYFYCLTCNESGPLSDIHDRLVDTLGHRVATDYPDLLKVLESDTALSFSYSDADEDPADEPQQVLSEDHLYLYSRLRRHSGIDACLYLKGRGISLDTAERLGLLYDIEEARIVFQVRSRTGLLHGFTGRAIDNDVALKVKDYKGLDKKRNLLGADLVKPEDDFILVVEGLFDYANMLQLGMPAVATMGAFLSQDQADVLARMGRPVYLFFDNDKAGSRAARKAADRLLEWVPVYRMRYPRLSSGKPLKDPGDIRDPDLLRFMHTRATRILL